MIALRRNPGDCSVILRWTRGPCFLLPAAIAESFDTVLLPRGRTSHYLPACGIDPSCDPSKDG